MIETCQGKAVLELLERVIRVASRYHQVTLSTPFMDDRGLAVIARLDRSAQKAGIGLQVATRPEFAVQVRSCLRARTSRLLVLPNLHAKLYGALGKHQAEHEVIVTSANLTEAGLLRNVELGLRITGSTPTHQRLIERVLRWWATEEFAAMNARLQGRRALINSRSRRST
ncbi:hypothetical protein [Archangium sp.]|uniref:hypothetical protein n=1 Tax=Archangium sp. TaxID=1872627 RepID=UPI00389AB322